MLKPWSKAVAKTVGKFQVSYVSESPCMPISYGAVRSTLIGVTTFLQSVFDAHYPDIVNLYLDCDIREISFLLLWVWTRLNAVRALQWTQLTDVQGWSKAGLCSGGAGLGACLQNFFFKSDVQIYEFRCILTLSRDWYWYKLMAECIFVRGRGYPKSSRLPWVSLRQVRGPLKARGGPLNALLASPLLTSTRYMKHFRNVLMSKHRCL